MDSGGQKRPGKHKQQRNDDKERNFPPFENRPSNDSPEDGDNDEIEEVDGLPTLEELKFSATQKVLGKPGATTVFKEASDKESVLVVPVDVDPGHGPMRGKVVALSVDTGRVLWEFKVDGPFGSGAEVSIDRKVIYFSTTDLHVYALNARNGKLIWDFHSDYSILAEPTLGLNGMLFIGDFQGTVYSLDAATGQLKWKQRVGKEGIWSRAVVGSEGVHRVVYVATLDPGGSNVFALDAENGKILWEARVQGAASSSLVLSKDLKTLFVGAAGLYQTRNANIVAFDIPSKKQAWSVDVGPPADFSPFVAMSPDGKSLLVTHQSGAVVALSSLDDPEKSLTTRLKLALLSPATFVSDSTAFFTSTDGHVYRVTVDGRDGNLTSVFNAGDAIWGSVSRSISSHGVVCLATIDGLVIGLDGDAEDARVLWKRSIKGYAAVALALVEPIT